MTHVTHASSAKMRKRESAISCPQTFRMVKITEVMFPPCLCHKDVYQSAVYMLVSIREMKRDGYTTVLVHLLRRFTKMYPYFAYFE